VILFYYEDRPTTEIAEVLDCSTNTVKVHLHRARRTLGIDLVEERSDVE
jgi:RNA polymerase sigma-70 factor (ECF subfamily)